MRFSSLLMALLVTTAQLAARTKCPPPASVHIYGGDTVLKGDALVWERSIEGTAIKDEGPLQHADVRLYAGNKPVRHTATDERGHFLLKDLSLEHYRLSFKGLGAFEIDMVPPHMPQQEYYTFSNYHGCLSVGFSADSNWASCLLGDSFVGCRPSGSYPASTAGLVLWSRHSATIPGSDGDGKCMAPWAFGGTKVKLIGRGT